MANLTACYYTSPFIGSMGYLLNLRTNSVQLIIFKEAAVGHLIMLVFFFAGSN